MFATEQAADDLSGARFIGYMTCVQVLDATNANTLQDGLVTSMSQQICGISAGLLGHHKSSQQFQMVI